VILELKEKLGAYELHDGSAPDAGGSLLARNALVELGWSMLDAERALSDVDEGLPVEEQVRAALRQAA
jgi:Holliday junction resolvasome RuvABC DNA-binding subunit